MEALILIVDDNPTNIKVMYEVLEQAGFRVLIAKNGESALAKLQAVTPDLILLDVMMPGIDGFETCRRLKANHATQDIPVIFMTALSEVDEKVKAFALGAVDYITKPFQQAEVLARVNLHLKLKQLTQQLEKLVEERTHQLTETVSDLNESQLHLLQSEKMSALGQLVAGVAHEINNPVSFINGNLIHAEKYVQDLIAHLRLYQQKAPESEIENHAEDIELEYLLEDLPSVTNSMKKGTQRIQDISISLRNFSRTDSIAKTRFDIHEGIDTTLLILKHRLKANGNQPEIKVIKEYGNLPLIECFPGQLNQVFMNLLANAIDAIEESSQHSSREHQQNSHQINIQTFNLNDTVKIQIQDSGIGIPEEIKTKIFEQLFTTKLMGKGTGLGLAISRQIIVEKHQGKIEVFSELGKGTEFTIIIPIQVTD
jgi:signal transduction histidine kinase